MLLVAVLTATGDIAVSSLAIDATPVSAVYLCTGRNKTRSAARN